MQHVLWLKCHGDPRQQGVTRAAGITLFVVPSLLGDSKTI
jgi:hypothetical protein